MEFRFRAGDRRSRSLTPARFSGTRDGRFSPQVGPFHGDPSQPQPPPFELEAAAWRERIIRGEVERRLLEEVCLIEQEVRRELAVARARFLGVLGPVPFLGPDVPFMPPPPADTLFGPSGPFLPPVQMPLMPAGMSPNWPPPVSFGEDGFDGRVGFQQSMLVKRKPMPPPKPKQKLKLREIEPNKSSETLPPKMKVSGVKSKADVISASTDPAVLQNVISKTIESAGLQNVISATTEPTELQNVKSATAEPAELQNVISATTEPTELQSSARYLSCAVNQVGSISNKQKRQLRWEKYLKIKMARQKKQEKKYLKRKMAVYGWRVAVSSAGPSALKKIHILVDGEMHEVIQQGDSLWCEHCIISCPNTGSMADHLRGKKHSLLNKAWREIKAVRMKNTSKKGAAATCEGKVNENGPSVIPGGR